TQRNLGNGSCFEDVPRIRTRKPKRRTKVKTDGEDNTSWSYICLAKERGRMYLHNSRNFSLPNANLVLGGLGKVTSTCDVPQLNHECGVSRDENLFHE
ncbi:hypothetical protein U1Q18_049512, partial [Sarracenia purpurea var. burkii]